MSTLQYQPLSGSSRTPLKQISVATWPAALGITLSIPFILAVCLTTDGRQTASNLWTRNTAVLIAVGGVALKGSLGALIGIALYHRLWLLLGREKVQRNGQVIQGLSVKQIESHHLASRLGVGMLLEPSASLAWICGIIVLLLMAAIVPALQYGVDVVSRAYDLNGTAATVIQDETPVLLVKINFMVIYVVLGLALVTALAALLYLLMATNHVPGRLMRDSLIHTFTVGTQNSDRSASASVIYLPQAEDQSLEQVLKAGGHLRLACASLRDLHAPDSPRRLVIEQERREGLSMLAVIHHPQPNKSEPEISQEPFPTPHLTPSRQSYQRGTPSISPEPSIYFHEPSDFQEVSRQYRIHSLPVTGPQAVQPQARSTYHDYYEPPTRLCDCRNPEHHHSSHL